MAKRILRYILIFILILVMIGTVFAGALAAASIDVIEDTPPVDFSNLGESLGEKSVIVDQEGQLIEELESDSFREIVPIEEIPSHVQNAFVAVEDERFYKHNGVDIIGIVRSALDNIMAGGIVRGGSTIAQQLARDLYLNDEQSLDRKIKEAYIALKMDEALTKDEILEIYLNRIFLGQNSYGIQSASQTYFSKDVGELTLGEAAALAALPQAPSEYALYNTLHAESLSAEDELIEEIIINGEKYFAVYNPNYEDRQGYILDKMLELGMITAEDYALAANENIYQALNPPVRQDTSDQSYYTGLLKDQVVADLMDKYKLSEEDALDMLYNGGLRITTTIDVGLQEGLNEKFEDFIDFVTLGTEEEGQETRFMDLDLDDDGNILNSAREIIYYKDSNIFDDSYDLTLGQEHYEFIEDDLYLNHQGLEASEGIIIVSPFYTTENGNLFTHQPTNVSIPADQLSIKGDRIVISQDFLENNSDFYYEDEAGIHLSSAYYNLDKKGVIQPQSSAVVIDQHNGHIKAIVGGRETSKGLNRAYETVRQPGSTMKPIAVYMPALDNGMTLASPIDDLPRKDENGKLWPVNWYGEYRGITTLRRSLETSSNVNAVNCLEMVGLDRSMEYLEKLGLIDSENPEKDSFITKEETPNANDENTSALALGGMNYGFSNLRMTGAYAALANKGQYIEPICYTEVLDRNDRLILEAQPDTREVVSEGIAFLITDAMRSTTEHGVATNAQIPGYDVAGKTGTSGTEESDLDSWYIGYTPYYTVGVWMGPDDQQLKINSISNITTSLWREISHYLINLEGKEEARFERPNNIIELEICNQSGKLPTDLCRQDSRGTIIKEYFVKGTEPKTSCDVHVTKTINSSDGLLATNDTPLFKRVERLFISNGSDYDPEDFDGLVPTDWDLRAPTEYSKEKDFLDSLLDSLRGDEEDSETEEETETEEDITEPQATEPPRPAEPAPAPPRPAEPAPAPPRPAEPEPAPPAPSQPDPAPAETEPGLAEPTTEPDP